MSNILLGQEGWEKESVRKSCACCYKDFGVFRRRHHCRFCGKLCCDGCSMTQSKLWNEKTKSHQLHRRCSICTTAQVCTNAAPEQTATFIGPIDHRYPILSRPTPKSKFSTAALQQVATSLALQQKPPPPAPAHLPTRAPSQKKRASKFSTAKLQQLEAPASNLRPEHFDATGTNRWWGCKTAT